MADDDDLIPQVIMMPECEADIAANPELAKAMQGMKEALLNAMQGVKDGRYATFDDAMEALTGQRPIKHEILPRYPLKHGYCLAAGPDPSGDGIMAIISDGHPRMHADCTILDVTRVKTQQEAEMWFERQCILEPWCDTPGEIVPLLEEDDDKTVTN